VDSIKDDKKVSITEQKCKNTGNTANGK